MVLLRFARLSILEMGLNLALFGLVSWLAFAQTSLCPCDLTQNACDPNCCCDSDCTATDKNAFTFCKNVDLNKDDRVCVSDQVINIANVQYRTSGTSNNLFCIYTDNYEGRNFYTSVQTATSASSFNELALKYGRTSFSKTPLPAKTYLATSIYKFGDPILLLFASNVQGFLSLPKSSIGSSNCDDQNPVGFMKNENTKCSRPITDLARQCTSNAAYSALNYYSGFKFVPAPSFLAGLRLYKEENITVPASSISATSSSTSISSSNSTTVAVNPSSSTVAVNPSPLPSNTSVNIVSITTSSLALASYSNPLLVTAQLVSPLRCKSSSGILGACTFNTPPQPTFDFATNTCKNVLIKASYNIIYDGTSPSLNITSVTADLILSDVTSSKNSFNQEFVVNFKKAGSKTAFERSGNPGYVDGLPILAGKLQNNAQLKKESIVLNSNPQSWLTLIKASATGSCSTSSLRTPVKFGLNIRSGCFISVKRAMTSQECSSLQNIIYNSLLLDFPTHAAMFGNSAVTNTADWVKIINSKPKITPTAVDGRCTNMVLGIYIEVLHSRTGYLGNPQSRIVGVQVKYDTPRIITFQCIGQYCQPGSSSLATQKIEVSQSVSFIDVSTAPEARLKPKPPFEAKAPNDFFFPFF